jgi:TonB family protein
MDAKSFWSRSRQVARSDASVPFSGFRALWLHLESFGGKDMSQFDGSILFCPLPDAHCRWKSFATSFSAQSAAIILLGAITLTAPQLTLKQFEHLELVAPPMQVAEQPQAAPLKPIPIVVKLAPRAQARPEFIAPPRITAPPPLSKLEIATRTPLPAAPLPRFDSAKAPAPARVERPLQTNVFAGSSATPTLPKMAASKVQTGGFGDSNGVPANPRATGRSTIASVGSFDLPAGPGYGNGTGGARGARGVIAGTGFGNGIAAAAPRPSVAPARVQTANFDPAPVVETKKPPAQIKAVMLPVSIQEKPTPVYTAEARKLHVEGEVLLQVMFTATGQVRVLRILRSLGYGLDEAAMRAAEKIRFSPAQQEGCPVDSTATLHIVFQLS